MVTGNNENYACKIFSIIIHQKKTVYHKINIQVSSKITIPLKSGKKAWKLSCSGGGTCTHTHTLTHSFSVEK